MSMTAPTRRQRDASQWPGTPGAGEQASAWTQDRLQAAATRTLCPGCGHDSISAQIITACYELGVEPQEVIKFSGIGCSSKTPAYFLSRSHGFNALHGRMPSVATGALMANHTLQAIGVSGDGDTGSASASASSSTWCAATCRWSTSSRTTACTA